MTAPEPTPPLTDADLARMDRELTEAVERDGEWYLTTDAPRDMRRLLAEVDRLRAELAEMETDRDKYQNWYDASVDDLREAYLSRAESTALVQRRVCDHRQCPADARQGC